jgi:hypothetical protein
VNELELIERRFGTGIYGPYQGDVCWLIGEVKRLRRELLESRIAGDHTFCMKRELELQQRLEVDQPTSLG